MIQSELGTPSTPRSPFRHPGVRRAARIAARTAAAVVALSALMVGTTMVVLRTAWGGERVRRQLVHRVNESIQGRLDIERLSFGGNKLVVWGVVLRDPDGGAVAEVARAEIGLGVGPGAPQGAARHKRGDRET